MRPDLDVTNDRAPDETVFHRFLQRKPMQSNWVGVKGARVQMTARHNGDSNKSFWPDS